MRNHNLATNVIPITREQSRPESDINLGEARSIFYEQSRAIAALATKINSTYIQAVEVLLSTRGHVIVCGIGKSGLIGKKIAATFASTGLPSFFVHPAEAFHGDLGMITSDDTVILISNSGETEEVIRLIPYIKQLNVPIVSMVGNLDSTLAMHSDVTLDVSVDREVCPNNLAPTNSTLATLAMGDALAVTLIRERNFRPHDFARFHPGGNLGRRLLARVKDVMHCGDLPIVSAHKTVHDSLLEMTEGRLGLVLIMDGNKLLGIVTDGDLRRALQKYENLHQVNICDIMTPDPATIHENAMLVDAEDRMKQNKIKALVVLDSSGKVSGIVEIFDD